MEILANENHPRVQMREGVPVVNFFFSSANEEDDALLQNVAEAFATQDEEVVLSIECPLAKIVEDEIDIRHLWNETKEGGIPMDEENRAFFAEVRAALVDAIAKIDSLRYIKSNAA